MSKFALKKRIVKISTPFDSAKIKLQINPDLLSRYSFEIDNDCDTCDFWIVWGDLPVDKEKISVKCPEENVLYMTDEAYVEKKFNQKFLNQFSGIITCRNDILHRNIIRTHEINVWQLNKSFLQFHNQIRIDKKKRLSVVCSDKTFLPGQKQRFAFVNKMIGHFKDRLDAYGRGFNPINDKWEALSPYKYSIAIENSALPGYFTEKITECFLAHTYPVYYGAPDIGNYFDSESYLKIDINDYQDSIQKIEKLLEEDMWEKYQDLLIEQKILFLDKYHFFPALSEVLDKITGYDFYGKRATVKSLRRFERKIKAQQILLAAKKYFSF